MWFLRFECGKQRIERVVDHVFERFRVPEGGVYRLNAKQRFPSTLNVGALRCERIEHAFVHGHSMPLALLLSCADVAQAVASFVQG